VLILGDIKVLLSECIITNRKYVYFAPCTNNNTKRAHK